MYLIWQKIEFHFREWASGNLSSQHENPFLHLPTASWLVKSIWKGPAICEGGTHMDLQEFSANLRSGWIASHFVDLYKETLIVKRRDDLQNGVAQPHLSVTKRWKTIYFAHDREKKTHLIEEIGRGDAKQRIFSARHWWSNQSLWPPQIVHTWGPTAKHVAKPWR